ncbi:hypothetical protein [Photobacterium nomapromontoriensis]|uniref:hypothetical protein n=1 Tax=Photobacterium nomapromontoriensis TaxID=2910237 RepID=UPI003D116D10
MRVSSFLCTAVLALYHHHAMSVELPINQYTAFQTLVNFQISSIQLPINIEEEPITLMGTDLNENSVRDDYEETLLKNYQQPEYVAMGILAAKQWQQIVNIVSDTDWQASEREAHFMLNTDKAITQCYNNLRKQQPDLFLPADAYFNTSLRTAARQAATRKLINAIDKAPHKHMDGLTGKPSCYVFKILFDTYVPENTDLQ